MKRMLLMAFLAATATAVVSDGPASAKTQAPSAASLVKVSTPCQEAYNRLAGSLSGMMVLAEYKPGPGSLAPNPKRERPKRLIEILPGHCCARVHNVCVTECANPGGCTGVGDSVVAN